MVFSGDAEEALADAQKGMRLDPRHPEGYFFEQGSAYNHLRSFGKAVDALKAAERYNPWTHALLAYAYFELGREQDARVEAAEVMRVSPHFSLEQATQREPLNWDDPSNQEFLAVLRKAGLK
jgi:tetratricopeptide (TPR) repeat protein